MSTEIRVWQIVDGKMSPLDVNMAEAKRKERGDLEQWIKSSTDVLGQDILIIGEQVKTKSGSIDFLGVDRSGNSIIIELKRDRTPREALTQAIDYASDVASWDIEKLSEECRKFTNQPLSEYLSEKFAEIDLNDISFNQTQRILLVGTSLEEPLQRMVEWLSNKYDMSVNAIIFRYIRTQNHEELIARTMVIPEEVEKDKIQKQQRKIPMSDSPGTYEDEELKVLLLDYLSSDRATPRRIGEILLPLCLAHKSVSRKEIVSELIKREEAKDEGYAGIIVAGISREIGIEERDYLRQVIRYDKPNPWEKENYRIEEKYKGWRNCKKVEKA